MHLFFNVFGILIYYPIPFMRIPLTLCKILGNTTTKYRWFAMMYLIVMFLILPAFIMGISLNDIVFAVIGIPFLIIMICVVVVNLMQRKHPKLLPQILRNWDFMPLFLHSLEPYDAVVTQWKCCDRCTQASLVDDPEVGNENYAKVNGFENAGYEPV